MSKYAVVVTTINAPTGPVRSIAEDCNRLDAEFILIGDDKSPRDFHQPGATYLDVAAQRATGFRYAVEAPTRHYARKNVGYLVAIRNGADVLIETDDDNFPRADFWETRQRVIRAQSVSGTDWVNAYGYFSSTDIWPRGLPLDKVLSPLPQLDQARDVTCPIQQGLADDNPDVDAIYRFIRPLPIQFESREPIALTGAWCPFNSQNTTFFKEAFPLLYLPFYCSFRMTDIWRSFVAQRIAFANNWGILFHGATVYQERNAHDLMRDFADEVPGYLHNQAIKTALMELEIAPGTHSIPDGMRSCYQKLCGMGLIGDKELQLLDAWLSDLRKLEAGNA